MSQQQLPPSPPARLDQRLASLPPADSPEAVELNEALRALPDFQAPASIWPAVRRRVDSKRPAAAHWQLPLALAASVMVLGVGLTLLLRSPSPVPITVKAVPMLVERSPLAELRRGAVALPASTGTEQVLRARIGGIDASLNRMLWQEAAERPGATVAVSAAGMEGRSRLLRERAALLESLRHIEQDRREELFRQALF